MLKIKTLLVVFLILLLSGCQSTIETSFKVKSPNTALVHTRVIFSDEAADSIKANTAVQEQIKQLFIKYAGSAPKITTKPTSITYDEDIKYAALAAASGLTGVKSAVLSGAGKNVALEIVLVSPEKLITALKTSVSTYPDKESVLNAILGQTYITISVQMGGGVHRASMTNQTNVVKNKTSSYVMQSLANFKAGTFQVEGNPEKSYSLYYWIVAVLLALLLIIGVFYKNKRKS